jgi:hypothetical protein
MIEFATLVHGVRGRNESIFREGRGEWREAVTYGDFSRSIAYARRFASAFRVSHALLLRTARHYVRAAMLWWSDGLEDEAVANVFFALEGCLLLFQEIRGGTSVKLDRKFLSRCFSEVFERGETLYEFIDDAVGFGGTRARIVHPELAWTEGWVPILQADDYFEYGEVVRLLLGYIVVGETFPGYDFRSASTGPSSVS